jgi:ketosteroid isomerase-like protein
MRDEEAVLAANAAFYTAFAARDTEAMDALWAVRVPVACIHPGWHALHGREQVMASWLAILTGPQPPAIRHSQATAYVFGDSAFVICSEHLPSGDLVATNVFVRQAGEWRMTHHHAGGVAHRFEPPEQLH